MTDRRTPPERLQPASRYRSPGFDDPQSRYESLDNATSAHATGSSRTRRRPSRTSSSENVPPQSAYPVLEDRDRGSGKRTKSSRNTLRKGPRRDSAQSDVSFGSQSTYSEEADDASGYVPKLSQIREAKEGRTSRSRASSTVSSSIEPRTRRRRHTTDHAVDQSRSQHKRGLTRRHSGSSATTSNPSVVSVMSEVNPQSSASNNGSTTATQRSYDDHSLVSEKMDHEQTNVFQYMQQVPTVEEYSEEEHHDDAPSTIVSSVAESSDESDEGTAQSSSAGSTQLSQDTPTTSPASTRRTDVELPQPPEPPQQYRHPKKPLYASSFVHGHGGDHEEEEYDESDEGTDVQSEEGDEEEQEEGSESDQSDHAHSSVPEEAPHPRVPSSSSRPSDHHTQRLRRQERELASHVLQSPQPQKDFQFAGGPSPHPPPPMPLYSPRAYSGATPSTFEAPTTYPPEWPPFPPPLAVEYPTQNMLQSPPAGHALPLAVQSPMGVTNLPAQQHTPPFYQHAGQPPQYQAHVPASEVTRTTAAGYELLANKLSEPPKSSKSLRKGANLVPMYRKFENLNHRVLLFLQDEVCELEEELRALDDSIVQMSPRDEAGHAFPASRRGDARYGGELHYKRTELLGRIFQKLGQYNQALTSFNSLLKSLDPASAEDIQAYRVWLEKRAPIDYPETRFLERKNDLLAVSRRPSVSTARGPSESPFVWLPLGLVIPLVAFAIVPSLLGRIVVIALITAAELRLVTTTPEVMNYLAFKEWAMAASL
ncbi:hypothetical protein FB567DRAFT_110276 [Paraphoma chrysanthemicola]|uniref:DUF6594 domain-containing protein n=1 Tax=Paraphoma chrysanthemicola TaxID=798071 RepID=A0A8K0R1F5_9PLEO|nr:hypothetical protein FB567DRAFT_110276 [Paraphoma chrysanthemicola]